jgi:hypothetical protein
MKKENLVAEIIRESKVNGELYFDRLIDKDVNRLKLLLKTIKNLNIWYSLDSTSLSER